MLVHNTNCGPVDYGSVQGPAQQRTGIQATITQDSLDNPGLKVPRSVKPPGFEGEAAGHTRGHLFGRQFGGDNRLPQNFVTMFDGANNEAMSDVEDEIAGIVRGGQTVNYSVIPNYDDEFSEIPSTISISARGDGGYSIDVTILNRQW